MKILMSAYSCEPGQGSERGLGWSVASEVAKHHQVWVLTRPDESKAAIEAELERNPIPNLKFVYFTLPFWQDSLRWGQSGAMQIHYYLWQIQAYFVARKLHQKIGFDVSHHVTFVKYASPSFLSFLPIPFVWGPVGGGEVAPKAFWQDFSFKAKIYETLRNLARSIGESDPFVRVTARNSAAIKATTKDTAERLHSLGVQQVEITSESSLTEAEIANLAQYQTDGDRPLRFISIGRLLHWKGFHLGLRGFAEAQLPDAEYWLVGDGAERQRLEALAIELGIAEQVKFWGRLPRHETLAKLGQCQVLVHPSLHDSGGWVCLEGMAAKKPVLCLNIGGPGVQVTEATGIRVAADNPVQVTQDLARAMNELAENKQLRQAMGEAGSKLVTEKYSLKTMGLELSQLYSQLAKNSILAA